MLLATGPVIPTRARIAVASATPVDGGRSLRQVAASIWTSGICWVLRRRSVSGPAPGSGFGGGDSGLAPAEPGQPAEALWPVGFVRLIGYLLGGHRAGSGARRLPGRVAMGVRVKSAGRGVPLLGGASIGVGVGGLLACHGLFTCGAGLPLGYLGLAALSPGGAYLGLLPLLTGQLAAPLQLPATSQPDSQSHQRDYDDHANHDPGDRSGIQNDTSSVSKQSWP